MVEIHACVEISTYLDCWCFLGLQALSRFSEGVVYTNETPSGRLNGGPSGDLVWYSLFFWV